MNHIREKRADIAFSTDAVMNCKTVRPLQLHRLFWWNFAESYTPITSLIVFNKAALAAPPPHNGESPSSAPRASRDATCATPLDWDNPTRGSHPQRSTHTAHTTQPHTDAAPCCTSPWPPSSNHSPRKRHHPQMISIACHGTPPQIAFYTGQLPLGQPLPGQAIRAKPSSDYMPPISSV